MTPEEFHKYYPRLLGWIDNTLRVHAENARTVAPSKAAGVAGIRISNVNTDIQLEELDAHVNRIIEFVLHPIVNNDTKKVTAVAITQMGLSGTPHLLSPAQRAALALITNELKQFKAAGLANTAIATS